MTAEITEKCEKPKTGIRNCSIDIARSIAALFVLTNHTFSLKVYGYPTLNSMLTSIESLNLPFFFMTAGYFFVCGILKGKKGLLPYLKRLIIPYTVWSVVYLLIDYFRYWRGNAAAFLKNSVFVFLVAGPSYHLWFFPTLMVSAILVTLFFRWGLEKLLLPLSFLGYAAMSLGLFYYRFFIMKFPGLASFALFVQNNQAICRMFLIGFPYFSAGYLVKLLMDRNGFPRRKNVALTVVFAVLLIAESWFLCSYKMIPTNVFSHYFIGVEIMLLLLEHPMPDKQKAAERCKAFAGHTYFVHPLYLLIIDAVYAAVFGGTTPQELRLITAILLCYGSSRLVSRINNRYLSMIAG